MGVLSYVSVSLSALCVIISIIVLLCVLTDYDRRSKLNRLFITLIFFSIGITISDVVAYLIEGNTETYAYYIVRIANFLHYAFGALILAAMTFYILAYLETKIKIPRGLKDLVLTMCFISMLLTIISQFTGIYYYIDEFNVYHRGQVFWLSQILPMVGMFLNMGIVLYYRKSFERKFLFFFLAYMILPMSALSLALMFYGITFINIATTLSVLVLYIGVQIDHTHNMIMQIKLMDNQLEVQSEHYRMLQSHISEVKKARHDLRHHLSAFQSYINTGETDKLEKYISEYKASLPDDTIMNYCENYAVNSVLIHYISMARNADIKVEIHTELPEKISISDSDLCIVFGNCIENAIEACRRVDGEKFIKINSMVTGNMLTIVIDNNFDGELTKKGDGFVSKKHGGGIGVPSVKSVIRKHNGNARFEAKDGVFAASLMLQIND